MNAKRMFMYKFISKRKNGRSAEKKCKGIITIDGKQQSCESYSNESIPIAGCYLEDIVDKMTEEYAVRYNAIYGIMTQSYCDYIAVFKETYRTRFRRDKDRILYCPGFRRLQHKTQVISSEAGDHQRTRMLHTLEVQQIAGSISDALKTNTDLTEAIAMGHDLGHTPFGHAAERKLNQILINNQLGSFSHAIQSVRILTELYPHPSIPTHKGLGIHNPVLEGILKHDADIFGNEYGEVQRSQLNCDYLNPKQIGSLESQIVYWADKIAYLSHDWEDFINYCSADIEKYIHEGNENEKLERDLKSIENAWNILVNGSKVITFFDKENKSIDFKKLEIRDIIRNVTTLLIANSKKTLVKDEYKNKNSLEITRICNERFNLKKGGLKAVPAMEKNERIKALKGLFRDSLIINLPEDKLKAFDVIRKFLDTYYIQGSYVKNMDLRAEIIIETLFNHYFENPDALPLKYCIPIKEHQGNDGFKALFVTDYISQMTDRYALRKYNEIIGTRSDYY